MEPLQKDVRDPLTSIHPPSERWGSTLAASRYITYSVTESVIHRGQIPAM